MFCLPILSEAESAESERIARPHFPRTYAEWLVLSEQWERENGKQGIARVRIAPRELAAFMRSSDRTLDIPALLDFAAFNPWHDPD
jgi:hypothetical protein